jgi:tRNA A-37 threonylcarbamoyl transferase component Bud32
LIGTTLDKYEVLQKVGEGGMATVYRGRHTTLDRDVAIKVLHPHLSSSTRNRKRFAREARAIEHLRHSNILEIFDYSGTDCSDCYIITEFVEGETLTSVMDRVGRMPSEVVVQVGMQLCEALSYAHTSGILHRDLKPDNVMIRADGRVKLMDFGIARFLDESQVTMTGALVGSPAFMSPEQAREEDLDRRSDLFSLGTLLFYLSTGHLPFSGSNPSLILKNIIEGNRPDPVELAPSMSATLSDVIERLLAPSRDERFNTANDALTSLAAANHEVGIADGDDEWAVSRYLAEPETYTEELETMLAAVLVDRGKIMMESGDHLAALRLYNRVLSIDEENTEVLAVVQGLHQQGSDNKRRSAGIGLALGVLAMLALGIGVVVWSGTRPQPPVPVVVVQPEPVSMVEPIAPPQSVEPAVDPDTAAAIGPAPVPADAPVVSVAPAPRPVAVPEPPPPEPLPSAPGYVTINSGNFSAYVYEDGDKLGFTRQLDPFELSPGVHRLTLQSAATEEREVEVAVGSGEMLRIAVELMPRPGSVFIPPVYADTCRASRNHEDLGTVGALDRVVSVPRPDRRTIVVLDCGDDGVFSHTFETMRQLNESFPPP